MQSVSQFLKSLVDGQVVLMNDHPIKHGPTIGEMYEGLTKEVLEKIDFAHPDVKVVSGFIKAADKLSGQIDCMVVFGCGEKITGTEKYIYPIGQVIAVFEVKKTLLGGELGDAYEHLSEVYQLSKYDYQNQQDRGVLEFSTERPAREFLQVFGKFAPKYEDNAVLPFEQRATYQALVRDWLTPLRIAIGYNGYKNELQLRKGLGRLLKGNEGEQGYGVANVPNLIISSENSIIKLNGMPYKGFWDDELGWCRLGSSRANPILLIMELLFDRVELLLGATPDRGLDLHDEVVTALVFGKAVQTTGSRGGWMLAVLEGALPDGAPSERDWQPLKLSTAEKDFLRLLDEHGGQAVDDVRLVELMERHGVADPLEFAKRLCDARVVLVSEAVFFICPGEWAVARIDEDFYCGDNAGDRFQKWVWNTTQQAVRVRNIVNIG